MSLRVSVVVPTFERAPMLARVLQALTRQTIPARCFEVIVVDDGSRRSLAERNLVAINGLRERVPELRVRYMRQPRNAGPAAARNRGWRVAAADIIAFTDDDTEPEPSWLGQGLRAMTGFDAVAGRVDVPLGTRPTDYERDAARLSQAEFVTANCFVRRAALLAVGGFDERYRAAWREDSDLQFALETRGLSVGRAPGAVVRHPVRPARWGVSLRQQRKVEFDALLYKKYPLQYRARIRPAPPWRYYAMTACLPAAALAALAGAGPLAALMLSVWGVLALDFAWRRLRGTRHSIGAIAEMLFTSALIPTLSVFWRLKGAWRYRVVFL